MNRGGSWLKLCLVVSAGGLIAYGAWGFWQQYEATHNPNPVIAVPSGTVTHSTETPDETVPKKTCANYDVPARLPRKIKIPSINTAGCIQQVGIDQHGQIAVPTNVHLAGWFVKSPLPGEKGISIIDGHVLGRYSPGAIFTSLNQLHSGDIIRIQFGDKSWKEFKVLSVNLYSVEQAADVMFKQVGGVKRQLTLITCGGEYNAETESYNKRVIVRAKLTNR